MPNLSEIILDNMATAFEAVTTAGGYLSDVGSDSVFRAPSRPAEDEIDFTKAPLYFVLDGAQWTPLYQKNLIMWTLRPILFGLVSSQTSALLLSQAMHKLINDGIRIIGESPKWPTSAAFDTRITGIDQVGEFSNPHTAFEISMEVKYEATPIAP